MFHRKFPEVAEAETQAIIASDHSTLPPGRYPLIELYCDESGCDCRRVMINVVREKTRTIEAQIAYGWEPRGYYVKWMGDDEPDVIDAVKGPAFNIGGPLTDLSDVLLEHVREMLTDRAYIDRLKRHYAMFRDAVEREALAPVTTVALRPNAPKPGRNELCPCGSGNKFKRCCGA
jgi:hypothetical protein